jgi:[ribosomal protein S18]-alanine N-acetyltransferase
MRLFCTFPRLARHYNIGVPLMGRDFQIREFVAADFDTLWSIDQACFPPGISYSRAELKNYMRRRASFTLVAVRTAEEIVAGPDVPDGRNDSPSIPQTSDAIAGFIVAEVGRGSGHIITIDVIASAQRLGAGSLLLRGAEDRLRVIGCQFVELETAVDNISALSFYKRHDYSVIRTSPRYYPNGVDALVLEKDLRPR